MERSGTLGKKSNNLVSPAGAQENKRGLISTFNTGLRSLVEKITWVSRCVNVCAIFPTPLQGLLGFVDLTPGLIALGYFPSPLRGF